MKDGAEVKNLPGTLYTGLFELHWAGLSSNSISFIHMEVMGDSSISIDTTEGISSNGFSDKKDVVIGRRCLPEWLA